MDGGSLSNWQLLEESNEYVLMYKNSSTTPLECFPFVACNLQVLRTLRLLRGDAFSVISTAQYEKIPRATSFRLGIYKIFKEFSRYASALPFVDYLTDQRAVR